MTWRRSTMMGDGGGLIVWIIHKKVFRGARVEAEKLSVLFLRQINFSVLSAHNEMAMLAEGRERGNRVIRRKFLMADDENSVDTHLVKSFWRSMLARKRDSEIDSSANTFPLGLCLSFRGQNQPTTWRTMKLFYERQCKRFSSFS